MNSSNKAESVHSRLPPSSAYRWTRCTASVKFIEENAAILPSGGSEQADEGTRAHAYLTATLKHTLGQVPDNEEMKTTIDQLVDFVHSLTEPGDRLLVDERVSLFYLPSEKGTLDVAVVGSQRIIVLDLKYGKGVSVYAEQNEQLAIYAESALRELERAREKLRTDLPVRLIIYQPRDRNDEKAVREWNLTRGQLADFCHHIQKQADTVLLDFQTRFEPGIACKFCRATGICKAYASQGLSVISATPVETAIEEPKKMLPAIDRITREQRQKILAVKSVVIKWLEDLENQETAELLNGAVPQQFKLVEGKSNRVWADPNRAVALLLQHFAQDTICPPAPPELLSPAQVEKLLKTVPVSEKFKADLHALIEKPVGKPTLVPMSDKRPALLLNPLEGINKISEHDPRDLI